MDQPKILDLTNSTDLKVYNSLVKSGVIVRDHLKSQSIELFKIRYPKYLGNSAKLASFLAKRAKITGSWVYLPWKNQLLHILSKSEYYELRTIRNNPLITRKLQMRLSRLTIGVAGLSVGSNIVRSLVYAGIGQSFKLADQDILETTNLNRITGNLLDLGENKATILARQMWEIDPYLNIQVMDKGLTSTNFKDFLISTPKLDVVFDEIDDLGLKFYLRLAARSARLLHIMVTDNGYSAEIDVARFDLSKSSGGMAKVPDVSLDDIVFALGMRETIILSPKQEQDLINTLIDSKNRAPEMKLASQQKLAQKIIGWPQLQAVAGAGGSLAVFALLKLVSKKLKSGKKVISLS